MLLFAGGSFLFFNALVVIAVISDPTFQSGYFALWLSLIMAAHLTGAIALCRWLEADIGRISSGVFHATYRQRLTVRWVVMISASAFWLVFILIDAVATDMSLTDRIRATLNADLPMILLWFVLVPVVALSFSPLCLVLLREIINLNRIGREMDVDLYNLDNLQAISNPGVRALLLTALLISTLPVVAHLDNFEDAAVYSVTFAVVLIFSPVFFFYFRPVWMVRNKIKQAKQLTLNALDEQLRHAGDAGTDLMTRRMFVETRMEWPIGGNIQKMVVFGLLPPLTWVMAAAVENLLY